MRVPLGISVGYAVYPDDGGTYEALLKTADGRMYRDKSSRRTPVRSPATSRGRPRSLHVTDSACRWTPRCSSGPHCTRSSRGGCQRRRGLSDRALVHEGSRLRPPLHAHHQRGGDRPGGDHGRHLSRTSGGGPVRPTDAHVRAKTHPWTNSKSTPPSARTASAASIAAFYRQVPGDPILGPMYPAHDLAGAETRLRDFLVGRFGGPQRYIEQRGHPRLRLRHAPFPIDPAARDRWLELMGVGAGRSGSSPTRSPPSCASSSAPWPR